jgi:AcrR family transcriptional regulator
MARTRAAALDGAVRCIEQTGIRKATMGDIAAVGGIAKATLYNHFRTKDDVLAALLHDQISRLGRECVELAGADLVGAFVVAAERAGGHPAVRRIAADEPAILAVLLTPGEGGAWARAREATGAVLSAAGRETSPAAVDLVLRWVVSHLASPGSPATRAQSALMLARGLPRANAEPAPPPKIAERR